MEEIYNVYLNLWEIKTQNIMKETENTNINISNTNISQNIFLV